MAAVEKRAAVWARFCGALGEAGLDAADIAYSAEVLRHALQRH